MGPGTQTKSSGLSLPSRPRFTFDLKTVPWTDGKGPQDEYADNVKEWCDLHDILPENNPNRLKKNYVVLY